MFVLTCPKCGVLVPVPTTHALPSIVCGCGAELEIPSLTDTTPKTSENLHVDTFAIITGGKINRHETFRSRLLGPLVVLALLGSVTSFIAYGEFAGPVPWWHDVLSLAASCFVFIGVLALHYPISYLHAWLIGLRCEHCRRILAGGRAMEMLVHGRCPCCAVVLDIARYNTSQ